MCTEILFSVPTLWPDLTGCPFLFFIPNFLQKKLLLKDPKVVLECYHKCHWYLVNPQSEILCRLWDTLFARPAGERHRSSVGGEPGAFILSLPPHWQEKRGTKNIYPYFYDVPSTSENIVNSAEPHFCVMNQQNFGLNTGFRFYSVKIIFRLLNPRSFSLSQCLKWTHELWLTWSQPQS